MCRHTQDGGHICRRSDRLGAAAADTQLSLGQARAELGRAVWAEEPQGVDRVAAQVALDRSGGRRSTTGRAAGRRAAARQRCCAASGQRGRRLGSRANREPWRADALASALDDDRTRASAGSTLAQRGVITPRVFDAPSVVGRQTRRPTAGRRGQPHAIRLRAKSSPQWGHGVNQPYRPCRRGWLVEQSVAASDVRPGRGYSLAP
jgi:hypothetical protein